MSAAVVYRMFDAEGQLLYVGCTVHLTARVQQHAKSTKWWDAIARIDVEHHVDHALALDAEKEAIRTELPLHNVLHKPLTPDELSAKREARAQKRADERQRLAERLREDRTWDPKGRVICTNCGRRPERFPKKSPLAETLCKQCGVMAFVLESAA